MRKKVTSDELRVTSEGMTCPDPPPEEKATAPVRVTAWAGRPNYECQLCAYATLNAERMAAHLKAAHGWREKRVISGELPVVSEEVMAAAAVAGEDENDQDEVK